MVDTHTQLIDLQIKIAYLESTVETLSEMIATQDRELNDMKDQLRLMYRYLQNSHQQENIAPFDLLADRPPHY
ncbi:SlyX family protein [Moraxella sp. Tifton1]|uniref:SlyX family protein n=1 Tax=Moraxella oculi TaxID=2940516 RepID=A0ABW8U540_9GAMM|nr:SlyX family protein [Moraxella sp. Tifton1]MCL1622737.1 SlyX family protein [Moraxella sp. Tifton1]